MYITTHYGALDLIKDVRLSSFFTWDSIKLYHYDEGMKSFLHYFDEPWTGDRFWEIQVCYLALST